MVGSDPILDTSIAYPCLGCCYNKEQSGTSNKNGVDCWVKAQLHTNIRLAWEGIGGMLETLGLMVEDTKKL